MSFHDLWTLGFIPWFLSDQNPAPVAWAQSNVGFFTLLIGGIVVFACLIPYLLGSINTAVLISRVFFRDDVRRHGSGNAGTTNMLRTYGKGAAIGTLLGDALKTALSILIASLTMGADFGGWLAALFCMIGHVFPIYYHFKGGKGVLCAATAIAILSPVVFLIDLAIFVLIVAISKYVSLGSIVSAFFLPLLLLNLHPVTGSFGIASVAMALLVIWCHRANIKRIQNRTENKLSFRKRDTGSEGTK